jgi:hypothetical protein
VSVDDDIKKYYWAQKFGCSWQQLGVASGFHSSKTIAIGQACVEGAREQIVVEFVMTQRQIKSAEEAMEQQVVQGVADQTGNSK